MFDDGVNGAEDVFGGPFAAAAAADDDDALAEPDGRADAAVPDAADKRHSDRGLRRTWR